MPKRNPRGFTLMEVLIASALVGMVLAMSMQGFMSINKVSNLTRSKTEGQAEAARAVQEVTLLLKRAHIIFFTGVPLGVQDEANLAATALANLPARATNAAGDPTIPTLLMSLAGGPQDIQYMFGSATLANLSNHEAADLFGAANRYRRQQFRFEGVGALTGTTRLRTGDPSAIEGVNRDFPSPLCYWAEANFVNAPDAADGNRIRSANIPRSWTFYVLYLAPMSLPREHAALSFAGPPYNFAGDYGPRRAFPAGAPRAQTIYPRSTVPFELRLLRIPNVQARRTLSPDNAPVNLPTDPSEPGSGHFLGAPFDHYRPGPTNAQIGAQREVNYDPYKIPMELNAAANLDRRITRGVTPIYGSGERVNGGGNHGNYSNIGNEPPTDAALAYRPNTTASNATDKVIASYIDPDSVPGTCVMLNNALSPDSEFVANPTTPRWVRAYNGPYTWNFSNAFIPAGVKPSPRRAFISITTRYRNDRRIPFQFATETAEVELEALVNYQSYERTKRE